MKTEKIFKTFIRFLKENNCYQQFIINLKNNEINFSTIDGKKYNEFKPYEIITFKYNPIDCFIWNSTKQGEIYWLTLNNKWKKIYNTINK